MIKIVPFPSAAYDKKMERILSRKMGENLKEIKAVEKIIEAVKTEGDSALLRYSRQFDAPISSLDTMRVTEEEMEIAIKSTDEADLSAIKRACDHISSFHRQQLPASFMDTKRPGTLLGQMVNPVQTAGIYVPGGQGGKTPLVSTVLMCGVPARIAGVEKIVMVTPPTRKGTVAPELLAAASVAGIDEIYKIGSAWAIAALAYGTDTIPKADVIVGPGNIYVTLAKKLLSGIVGIDMIAGPSEILIVSDHTGNPDYIAADLLSQAEHDPMASSILITTEKELAEKVVQSIEKEIAPLSRKAIAEASLKDYGLIITVESIETAIDMANELAPEHMELLVENPFEFVGAVKNAGALFLGPFSPEPVGDYIAGPNHVLPTVGTAKFSSALSVEHFIKKTSIIHYGKAAFMEDAPHIRRLAKIEGLTAHERSISIREEDDPHRNSV